MSLNPSSKLCFSKRLVIVSLILFFVGLSVIIFSTLSSSVNKTTSSRAATNDSTNNSPCGYEGGLCCAGEQTILNNYSYKHSDSLSCNESYLKCYVDQCVRLEDICGVPGAPCCFDDVCIAGSKCIFSKTKDSNYPNPWFIGDRDEDEIARTSTDQKKEMSRGICTPKPTPPAPLTSKNECGRKDDYCCIIKQNRLNNLSFTNIKDARCDENNQVCVYKNGPAASNADLDKPNPLVCRNREYVVIDISYYRWSPDYSMGEVVDIDNNSFVMLGAMGLGRQEVLPNSFYIFVDTNYASYVPASQNRQYWNTRYITLEVACNYKSDANYNDGTWNRFYESPTGSCKYNPDEIKDPVTIAVRLITSSGNFTTKKTITLVPRGQPIPTTSLKLEPTLESQPGPSPTTPPQPTSGSGGSCTSSNRNTCGTSGDICCTEKGSNCCFDGLTCGTNNQCN